MKKGLILTLTVVVALLCSSAFSYAPVIGAIPDVWIGDEEDNAGSTIDLNFFRFSNAFNFDEYVSGEPGDEDFSTTEVRWSFLADSTGLITINGIDTIADASESLNPDLISKELTSYGNNDAVPRASSNATFYDLVDSPTGLGPPWGDPSEATALNEIITIYASNGLKADSRQIMVVANVQDGVTELPDALSGGKIHVKTWDDPINQGWGKGIGAADGTFINAADGAFYIATHSTDAVGAAGRVQGSAADPGAYGSWQSPGDEVAYVANNVYQAQFTISTTQTDLTKVPNCRLYIEFLTGGSQVVVGGGRVGASPFAATPAGKVYTVYCGPGDLTAQSVDYLRFKFEVIDFSVDEEGTNYMDKLEIYRFEEYAKGTPAWSQSAPFSGWSSTVLHDFIPSFGDVTVSSDSSGLKIETPLSFTTANINYGAWALPAGSSGVAYEADKLYRCIYTLAKGTSSDDLGKIRMINQNTTGKWVSILELIPDFASGHMPDTSGKEYSIWYETMPQLYGDANDNMAFQFDISDGSNTQVGTVIMSDIELYTYSIP